MIGSSFTKLVISLGTLAVMLPPTTLSQTLLQPSYSTSYPDSLFSPSASYHKHRKASKHGVKKASSNWDQKPHSYYQPAEARSSSRYSNHQDDSQEHDDHRDYSPQSSHHNNFDTAPTHHAPSWGGADESSHDGSRVHFHVSGHKGPKSYRFGYDTGKGKARHFRYEERDGHGMVHGRYGYHDKHGQMHVFHYHAHPHHGYHAKEVDPHKYGRR